MYPPKSVHYDNDFSLVDEPSSAPPPQIRKWEYLWEAIYMQCMY